MKKDFFTWQPYETWQKAKKTGVLKANCDMERYPKLYSLMKREMEKKIRGYKKEDGIIWMRDFYIDLNFSDHGAQSLYKQVLLMITLDENKALASNYHKWNDIVLDYSLNNIFPSKKEFKGIFKTDDIIFLDMQYTTGAISTDKIVVCEETN